jgi:hypothetical protein
VRSVDVAKMLGTTEKIVASNSNIFAKEVGKYIGSNMQIQYHSMDDDHDEEELPEPHTNNDEDYEMESYPGDSPSLWPLIRQVRIRCPSNALSTGAVLVDLPGVADVNAARDDIAKTYMKKVMFRSLTSDECYNVSYLSEKCDCVWIVAPVSRAVDDKTARGEQNIIL